MGELTSTRETLGVEKQGGGEGHRRGSQEGWGRSERGSNKKEVPLPMIRELERGPFQ